jgi:hypothetical protein
MSISLVTATTEQCSGPISFSPVPRRKLLATSPVSFSPFAPGQFARTDRGLLIQDTRTAKNTNRNVNPIDLTGITKRGDAASVASIVDDSAKLLSGGIAAVCTSGMVLKLDNSLGTGNAAVEFAGALGTANRHQAASFVRGSGNYAISIVAPGTVTAPSAALGAEYAEVQSAQITSQATRVLSVSVAAGGVVYIALERVEQLGSATTSGVSTPIVIDESVTRAADVITQETRALPAAASLVISGEAAPYYVGNQILFVSSNPQNDGVNILRNASGEWRVLVNAAGTQVVNTGSALGGLPNGAEFSIAISWSNGNYSISLNGAPAVTYAGAAIGSLTKFILGSNGSAEQFNGYIKRVTLFGSDINAV